MLLDDQRLLRERDQVVVSQRKAIAIDGRHVDRAHAFARTRLAIDHLDRLGAEVAPQYRMAMRAERWLVEVELVWIHGALHDGFAEAIRGRDEHHVAESGVGVEREHHATRAEIGAHHLLNACRERDLRVIETLMHAIRNRPVVEERGEHVAHGLDDRILALHVEKGFLLTRKRSLGQIFGGGRGAYCHRRIGAEASITLAHRALEFRGQGYLENPAADVRAHRGEAHDIIDVEGGERLADAPIEAILRKHLSIGRGGGGEAAGYFHSESRERADHFADRGIFAADDFDVVHAQAFERQYECGRGVYAQWLVLGQRR